MLNMQNRMMELQQDRIANGEGLKRKYTKRVCPCPPTQYQKHVKDFFESCRDSGIKCTMADAAAEWRKQMSYGEGGALKRSKRSNSKSLKPLRGKQQKAANRAKNVCYNYDNTKDAKYWQGDKNCIKMASHKKNVASALAAKKKKALAAKKKKALLAKKKKALAAKKKKTTKKRSVRGKGGCGDCPYCNGSGFMDAEY